MSNNNEFLDGEDMLFHPLRGGFAYSDDIIKKSMIGSIGPVEPIPPNFPKIRGPLLSPITIQQALDKLKTEMQKDSSYAWSWHCQIAMAVTDQGIPGAKANKIAEAVMTAIFGVSTRWSTAPIDKLEPGKEAA